MEIEAEAQPVQGERFNAMAACDLIPRLNAMKFSGARSAEHESINRVHVGVVRGALGKDEWYALRGRLRP